MQKTQARKHSYSASAPKAKSARKTKTDYYDYSLVAIIVLLICFRPDHAVQHQRL